MSDRDEILSITSDLREGYMSTDEAKRQLLELLNVSDSRALENKVKELQSKLDGVNVDVLMNDILHLCFRYYDMFSTERAVKESNDTDVHSVLVKGYLIDKEIFDEQYTLIENKLKAINS